jgi:3-oxoacyl-[acyl-carrier-protein] synthase III
MIHRLTDPNDPGCFLWSDGAGAAVLEGGNLQGFVGAAFQADGAYVSGWVIAAGGTFEPASVDAVKAGRTQMRREKGTFFHGHAAPLGCNRNRGLADLGEQQLIYVVCREAVFGGA